MSGEGAEALGHYAGPAQAAAIDSGGDRDWVQGFQRSSGGAGFRLENCLS